MTRDFDLGCGTKCGFFKRHIQVVSKIGAALSSRPAAPSASEEIAEAENVAENIAEVGKDIRIETAEPGSGSGSYACVSETVVARTLLRIAQNRIGLGSLFEFFLGFMVPGIPIGVILERKFAIGALDFLFGGVP